MRLRDKWGGLSKVFELLFQHSFDRLILVGGEGKNIG